MTTLQRVGVGLIISVMGLTLFNYSSWSLTLAKASEKREVVTLRWSVPGAPQELEVRKEQMRAFEKRHPGIKIQFEEMVGSRWQRLLTLIAAGEAPDVIYMQGGFVRPLAAREALVNLEPYVERDSQFFRENTFYPGWLNATNYQGQRYGIIQEFTPLVIYYNQRLFDEAGISYPDTNWTWKTFLESAQKLTEPGKHFGFAMDTWYLMWPPFVWQNSGHIFNKDGTKCLLDQPEAYEGIQFLADLTYKYKVAPTPAIAYELGFADGIFMAGKVAMTVTGAWMIPDYRVSITGFNWDVGPLPKGKQRATSAPNLYYGISTQSEHPEEAWKFIKFLTGKEGQKIIAQSSIAIPGITNKEVTELFLEKSPLEHAQVFFDSMKYAHFQFELFVKRQREIAQVVIQPAIDSVIKGSKTAEEAMKEIVPKINQMLRE